MPRICKSFSANIYQYFCCPRCRSSKGSPLSVFQRRWFSWRVVCGFFLFSFLLGCCSQNQPAKVTEPLVRHSGVYGGVQPVIGAKLQLYEVGTTGDGSVATPLLTQPTVSDGNGNFDITGAYTCPSPSALVYITATGGNAGLGAGTNNTALALMAVLGPCGNLTASTFIHINELTTVAAVWSLAPFMSSYSSIGSGPTDTAVLASAFTLASEYVNTTTGTAPGLNVPAGTTVPVAQLNTLADILSTCVNSAGGVAGDGSVCGTLFAAATPNGGTPPVEVIGAGLNIANNPTANVSVIMGLAPATGAPFVPTISLVPVDWTVGLIAPAGLSSSSTALTFSAAYLSFPSMPQTLMLTNNGPLSVPISNLQISGEAASDFSVSFLPPNYCPSNLAAGATCALAVSFTPSATGPRNATLLIESGSVNSTLSIPLTGTGLSLSGGPVTLSPSSLTFTLAGVPQNVIVSNNGTTSVAIGSISVSIGSQTNNCGSILAAQSICTIAVEADSLTASPLNATTGTLTVIDSADSGTQTLPVSIPLSSATFSAAPLNFGDWALGITSPLQTVTATANSAYTTVPPITGSITGPQASDFVFAGIGGCFTFRCQQSITFTPSGPGSRTATFVTNYGNVALSGNGIADGPSVTITPYTPVVSAVGVSAAPSTLTIVNNGSTPLNLSSTVTGANASDFAVTGSFCNGTLNPSNNCTLNIVFTPSQVGVRTATLALTDSTSGVSKAFSLNATGTPMAPTLTPNVLTFANTDVGSMSAAQTVMVSAPNGDPVGFQPSSGNNDFVLSAGTCATQTPCQISINFKPTRIGSISASYVAVDLATTVASQLTLFGHGGISAVALSSSSLTFSPRALGTTSLPQTLTLTNTGDAVLTISAVTFIGANAGDFPIEGNTCGNSVAAGGNCTISVSFSPSASGSRSATLQVVSNAASSPDSIQLLGTGN